MIFDIDLMLTGRDNRKAVVEIKYYRTRKPSRIMLERAIKRIKLIGERISIKNQILVVGLPIDNNLKAKLSYDYNIKIVDSNNLLFLIDDNEELLNKFYDLMKDISIEVKEKRKLRKLI